MKLNPGERSILASFFQQGDAEAAMDALKGAGFSECQLDRISEFRTAPGANTGRPGTGDSSLASAVLYDQEGMLGDEGRILLAATPDVSGMAGEVRQEAPYLLTIVTSEERVEEARGIVQEYRGRA